MSMPELVAQVLAFDGLIFLAFGANLAGVVRGFSGFGTAMVYLPFAGQVGGPFVALTSLIMMDLVAPLMHVPRAARDGRLSEVFKLVIGVAIAAPLGVWVLSISHPDVFRWGVSLIALTLLTLLLSGFRYHRSISNPMIYGTGLLGGFLTGSVGMPGPPVIFLYMASSYPVQVIRANNMLYLILADVILFLVFAVTGHLTAFALALGVAMIIPYSAGNWIGGRLFNPKYDRIYRAAAYVLIACSAILGLPIWD